MNKAILYFALSLILAVSSILFYRYLKKHKKKFSWIFLAIGIVCIGFCAILLLMFVYILLIIVSAGKAVS